MKKRSTTQKRVPKDLRYRDKCFPGAESELFMPKGGGYAPLPYIARELLSHLEGSELKVWIYLLTRAGQYSICYPTYEDIQRGTGIRSRGTVSKAMRKLEQIGLIKTHNDGHTRRYLLRDPRLAIEKMYQSGRIDVHALEDANDLLELVGQPVISTALVKKVVRP